MRSRRLVWLPVVVGAIGFPLLASLAADESRPKAAAPAIKPAQPQTKNAMPLRRRMEARAARVETAKPQAAVRPAEAPSAAKQIAEDAAVVAARVDELIGAELAAAHVEPAPICRDEDYLRRVSVDISGVSPSPRDVTLFSLDPDSQKRRNVVDRLLDSDDYAENWTRYWRDVIFLRATETRSRIAQRPFEEWMKGELRAGKPWDQITTALLTATGDVSEVGQTALVFAQRADPAEVAAETSRIFLGIQLQCANCHDHPTDSWKREQFHSLAAFFPRISSRRKPGSDRPSFEIASVNVGAPNRQERFEQFVRNADQFVRRLDKDRDGKVSKEESSQGAGGGRFLELVFAVADTDKDGKLSAVEIRKMPPPPDMDRRGSLEYFMPDLNNPQSPGKKFDPTFFLGDKKPGAGLDDQQRRTALARYITSPDNPWFAKAFVNRIWGQLVGEGFYMPIDDIGPERTARHPAALDALAAGFTASGYDVKWLFRTITATAAYQRQIQPRDPKQEVPAFASASPIRLRAEQIYDALTRALGFEDIGPRRNRPAGPFGMGRFGADFHGQFVQAFGLDPSTPPDEIIGTLPQALILMNSPLIAGLVQARGETRLAQILTKYPDDDDALKELFLVVHAREPSEREMTICREFLGEVKNRQAAFEDILWSLLNSTEFQTKR